jgi:hypothetical protein
MLNADVDGTVAFSGYPLNLNPANLDSAWTRLKRITRSWTGDFLAPARFAKPGLHNFSHMFAWQNTLWRIVAVQLTQNNVPRRRLGIEVAHKSCLLPCKLRDSFRCVCYFINTVKSIPSICFDNSRRMLVCIVLPATSDRYFARRSFLLMTLTTGLVSSGDRGQSPHTLRPEGGPGFRHLRRCQRHKPVIHPLLGARCLCRRRRGARHPPHHRRPRGRVRQRQCRAQSLTRPCRTPVACRNQAVVCMPPPSACCSLPAGVPDSSHHRRKRTRKARSDRHPCSHTRPAHSNPLTPDPRLPRGSLAFCPSPLHPSSVTLCPLDAHPAGGHQPLIARRRGEARAGPRQHGVHAQQLPRPGPGLPTRCPGCATRARRPALPLPLFPLHSVSLAPVLLSTLCRPGAGVSGPGRPGLAGPVCLRGGDLD